MWVACLNLLYMEDVEIYYSCEPLTCIRWIIYLRNQLSIRTCFLISHVERRIISRACVTAQGVRSINSATRAREFPVFTCAIAVLSYDIYTTIYASFRILRVRYIGRYSIFPNRSSVYWQRSFSKTCLSLWYLTLPTTTALIFNTQIRTTSWLSLRARYTWINRLSPLLAFCLWWILGLHRAALS